MATKCPPNDKPTVLMQVRVNNASVLCVCASVADAWGFIIHQLKADLKITSVFTGCIHTCSSVNKCFVMGEEG